MAALPNDPLASIGIDALGAALRNGTTSCEAITAAYLGRIAALDGHLGAFIHVASEQAMASALALDRLLAAGIDLGPLMGMPVAIKDLYTVAGMPTCAGSRMDISDLVQPEGHFVGALRRAGCIIIGKTRMTEFALGGINLTHRIPWNPWDATTARTPGGSSGGSAVAMAAGLCAFSIGSDTGGSVRVPAALCGVFGYKATQDLWPTDGMFPLSPTLDSIGTFSAGATDAARIFSTLTSAPPPQRIALRGLRLGLPNDHFFDELAPAVDARVRSVLARLEDAGVLLVRIAVPEASEIDSVFSRMVPAELVAYLGRERFVAGHDVMDPVVWSRASQALDFYASDYIRLLWRQRALCAIARERMHDLDAWIAPSVARQPTPLADYSTVGDIAAWNAVTSRNARPANLFGQCALSMPIPGTGAELPVGVQIMCNAGDDNRLLSIAMAIEDLIGPGGRPDVSPFEETRRVE